MDMETIGSLFRLFSGETDVALHLPLLYTAVGEVRARLREDADEKDIRLAYLAAAIANVRYAQIYAAREKVTATYAGTIATMSDGDQVLRFAESLVSAYCGLCAELLTDKGFDFFTVRG